ncbi:MAG TPA: M28 family peptidase [Gemmatimonadaceae bacterium]|nr:M28 family peptidase [Gemmatimonadaceae bacterium]
MTPRGMLIRSTICLTTVLTLGACASASHTDGAGPTQAPITAADLRTRLTIFADDSMMGRQAGTEGAYKGTAYIAAELQRLGLEPAGDSGTYFQRIPLVRRSIDSTATIAIDDRTYRVWNEYVPVPVRGTPRDVDGAEIVLGGALADSTTWISNERAAGKVVVLDVPAGVEPRAPRFTATGRLGTAAAIVLPGLEEAARTVVAYRAPSTTASRGPASAAVPSVLIVAREMASRMSASAANGVPGKIVKGRVGYVTTPAPGRNVVAILRGSDPALRGQYVAIGAHSDHVGIRATAVDHDSMKVTNAALFAIRMANGDRVATSEQRAALRVNVDSAREGRPPRRDSISNGADDDGSGSVAVLEIAEAIARAREKPRRSLLFVWHDAEEIGLVGARWFTDHPTVPRDSIVAQLNIDMIGRGRADERPNGGERYLQIIGARRLSTQLGEIIDTANRALSPPFVFDYTYDADGHPERIYCRSDHYHYARYGIPIAFFTTGLHGDYHQVTDEVRYIDFPHFARITSFVHDVTLRIANRDQRPVVDKPYNKDPDAPCVQ